MTIDLEAIATETANVVSALAPFIEAADPALALPISIGQKIAQAALAGAPAAIALYNQVKTGTPLTAAQLAQFETDYQADWAQLDADIKAKIAALPAA